MGAKGFDCPALDTLFLAAPVHDSANRLRWAGRLQGRPWRWPTARGDVKIAATAIDDGVTFEPGTLTTTRAWQATQPPPES